MATIVVETGTGSATANSYVSEADLTTYATDRGVTLSGDTAVLLIQAMDYIESQAFLGWKYTEDQALQWPRAAVYIDGYVVDTDEIPQLLIDALCEVAIGIDGGVNPLANEDRMTLSEKVGEIAVTYSAGSRNYTYLKAAHTKLRKLLAHGASGVNAPVIRA
jgi:hypothetical protein